MKTSKLPYYPMYVDDFEDGVINMDCAAVGVYILALGHSWKHGHIPDCPDELARVIRQRPADVRKAWAQVRQKFTQINPGVLVNERQQWERAKVISKSEKATQAVRTRYQKSTDVGTDVGTNAHTSALLRASESGSSVVSELENLEVSLRASKDLPFDTLEEPKIQLVRLPVSQWFEEFWGAYWRKVGRSEALKAFKKYAVSEETKTKIIAAVHAQIPQYMARGSEHRPHASTWLNQRRFEEDPEIYEPPKSKLDLIMERI